MLNNSPDLKVYRRITHFSSIILKWHQSPKPSSGVKMIHEQEVWLSSSFCFLGSLRQIVFIQTVERIQRHYSYALCNSPQKHEEGTKGRNQMFTKRICLAHVRTTCQIYRHMKTMVIPSTFPQRGNGCNWTFPPHPRKGSPYLVIIT